MAPNNTDRATPRSVEGMVTESNERYAIDPSYEAQVHPLRGRRANERDEAYCPTCDAEDDTVAAATGEPGIRRRHNSRAARERSVLYGESADCEAASLYEAACRHWSG